MTQRQHRLSAAIITLNEERSIERCLSSLTWVDEIVVIDGMSTDRTRAIVTNPSAPWASRLRWIENRWAGFNAQRTLAMNSALYDWILVVDSDEACSDELRKRIDQILAEDHPHPAWKVRRQEYFLGKPIHWGVWNPSYQDRFFHRKGVRYQNDIHEYPVFPVEPRRIYEPLHHWPDFNPEVFLGKMNRYTSIEARDRVNAGQRTSWFRMLTTGPAMFLKNYFYYKAYRDGIHGFAISILEGVSRAVRHVKMWQYANEKKRSQGGAP